MLDEEEYSSDTSDDDYVPGGKFFTFAHHAFICIDCQQA